ncbi:MULTISPECIES: hypothetical protein [Vibrio]|uniref:hypothetical protein n=1 Tax=Vibrio TaxID=662 RepID=UPI00111D4107|nr:MULTISPECIES: hypothetical protein [Vibrio]EJE8517274.1 hypothetical protein [Vibrio parahaemolyticus]MCR9834380.1 hypothetical protein [Vibrio parahaemolyticus]MDF4694575.1 hypothetical protein [Vibrio parahaemolyticus]MDG2594114.1 hypothetical protein [Vibrio parahaemolyticus]MDW1761038.1 hypothetical protein [Vibrio sp. Vb2135]
MQIRFIGEHISLLYRYLTHLGYSEEEIQEKGVYCPLISLTSTDTSEALFGFLLTEHETLFSVLKTGGFNHLIFVLQQFVENTGLQFAPPTQEDLTKSFNEAVELYNKEKVVGCEIIMGFGVSN